MCPPRRRFHLIGKWYPSSHWAKTISTRLGLHHLGPLPSPSYSPPKLVLAAVVLIVAAAVARRL